jgi:hypothetical protein
MNNKEFSIEFDILYNNLISNKAPGLNEYEKSVCLTQAQEFTILSLYGGSSVKISFENTEEVRRALDALVNTKVYSNQVDGYTGLVSESKFYSLPDDLWFITYEEATIESDKQCNNGAILPVVPVTQDDFYRIYKNPFRTSNDRRILRLDCGKDTVELVTKHNIKNYLIRYIRRPKPIILENLDSGLSIGGISNMTECELDSALHRVILKEAVNIAINTFAGEAKE